MKQILYVHTEAFPASAAGDDAQQQSLLFTDEGMLEAALAQLQDGSIDEARLVGFLPNDDAQGHIFRILRPLAKLAVEGIASREAGQELSTDLQIQGFFNILAAKGDGDERFVVCQKPEMELGASAALPAAAAAQKKGWVLNTSDLAEGDLVDEDALLDDGLEFQRGCGPAGESKGAEGGKKRACKNCSCGLAEQEAAQAQAAITGGPVQEVLLKSSGCGSCAKGDAFRCASCPFLGKPAFEPGQEKVVLAMGDDDF